MTITNLEYQFPHQWSHDANANIFKLLDARTLNNCCQVNKEWNEYTNKKGLWETLLSSVPKSQWPSNMNSAKNCVLYGSCGSEDELIEIIKSFASSAKFNENKELSFYYPVSQNYLEAFLKARSQEREQFLMRENRRVLLMVDEFLNDFIGRDLPLNSLENKCREWMDSIWVSVPQIKNVIEYLQGQLQLDEWNENQKAEIELIIAVWQKEFDSRKSSDSKQVEAPTEKLPPIVRVYVSKFDPNEAPKKIELVFRNQIFSTMSASFLASNTAIHNGAYVPNIGCEYFFDSSGLPLSFESLRIDAETKKAQESLPTNRDELLALLNEGGDFGLPNGVIDLEKIKERCKEETTELTVVERIVRILTDFQRYPEGDKAWLSPSFFYLYGPELGIDSVDQPKIMDLHDFLRKEQARLVAEQELERTGIIEEIEPLSNRCFSAAFCAKLMPGIVLVTGVGAAALSYFAEAYI